MKANVMWGGAIKFAHSQLVCCSSFFFYYFFLLVRFSVLEAERRRKKGEKKKKAPAFSTGQRTCRPGSSLTAVMAGNLLCRLETRYSFFFLSAISREGKDHTGSTIQIYI